MKKSIFLWGITLLLPAFATLAGCQQISPPAKTPSATTAPTVTPPATTMPDVVPAPTEGANWQTYTDTVRGFSLKYPGASPVDITLSPVALPQAVGEKDRQLKVEVTMEGKTQLDSDGCLVWQVKPVSKNKLTVNQIPLCLTVLDDGAAGSTYRNYHYTTLLKNQLVADITMNVRFPTSVRVYAGCENDADQTKQSCLDLAFDETRDTALFKQILDTLRAF